MAPRADGGNHFESKKSTNRHRYSDKSGTDKNVFYAEIKPLGRLRDLCEVQVKLIGNDFLFSLVKN